MSDNSPSVELAPLRGSILLDLDKFDEAVDSVQDKIVSLSDLFNIALNPHIDIDMSNFNDSLESARKRIEDLENEINSSTISKDVDININTNVDDLDHLTGIANINDLGNNVSDNELHNLFDPAETESNLNSISSAANEATNEVKDLESALETVANRSEETWSEAFGKAETEGTDLLSKFDSALLEKNKYLASAMQAQFQEDSTVFKNSADDEEGDDSDLDPANISGYGGGYGGGQYMRRRRESEDEDEDEGADIGELGSSLLDKGMMLQWTIAPMVDHADKSILNMGFTTEAALNMANREFGNNSSIVQNWSQTAVEQLGLSSGSALNMADKFGLSARSMGANKNQAAKLAEHMTSLADQLNLATGGQISLASAGQLLTGVMGGQTYGLKKLGINFSTSQQNAEAAALGYGHVYSKLTPLQQAYVNTALLQGSLNDTLGTLNGNLGTNYGQWEKTKAQLQESGEAMATTLLPVINKLMHGITHVVKAFSHLGKAGQYIAGGLLLIGTVVAPVFLVLGGLLKLVGGTYKIFKKLFKLFGKGAKEAEKGADDVGKAVEDAADDSKGIIDVFKDIGKWVLDAIDTMIEWGGKAIEIIGEIIDFTDPITLAITAVIVAVAAAGVEIAKHWKAIKKFTIDTFHDIEKEVTHVFSEIYKAIKIELHKIEKEIENTFKYIYKIVYNNPIVHAVGYVLFQINHLITSALNALNKVVISFLQFVWSWIKHYFDEIVSGTENFLNYINDKIRNSLIYLGDKIKNFFDWLGSKIESSYDSIKNKIENFFDWLGNKIMVPINMVRNAMTIFSDDVKNGVIDTVNYLKNKWTGVYDWFKGVLQEPIDAILSTAQAWENAGARLIDSLLNGIKNAFVHVADWIGNEISHIAGDITGFASSASSSLNRASYHGSHATGLYNVPWDGYHAELHSGEMVLTKDQAEAYRSGTGAGNGAVNVTINSPKALDPFEVKRQMEQYSRNIANGIY